MFYLNGDKLFFLQVLGKVGKIVKIDSDGDVAVVFGPKAVVLNPACCSPATGTQTEELDDDICSGSEEGTYVRPQRGTFGLGPTL